VAAYQASIPPIVPELCFCVVHCTSGRLQSASSDWTWSLITYLTDHPAFHKKLLSDSTAEANKEGWPKAVGKNGKPQQLKKEYTKHLKTLGATGAGLDPKDIIPGIDHAAAAVAIFEGSAPDDGQNADCLEVRSGDGDKHAADELEEDDKEDDYEQVPQRADPEPPSANLEAILSTSGLIKPATMMPKPSKIKAALSGHDAGLAKAATTTPPRDPAQKAPSIAQMANMANKRVKYELKYASCQKAATEERNAKLEELGLQIELARLNAQIAGISPASQLVISASTPSMLSPTMRPVLGSYNSQDMIFGSH
ncbi:hypothetical protein H0H81_006745, partial [Sphagnurus paluster]